MATDVDENDMLTYTLWYGTSADNITTKGKSSNPTKQGESVTIEQNEGLSNDTRYWFKVVVTDGTDEAASRECNESTYCKGEHCEGISYSYEACTKCDSSGKLECTYCRGLGGSACNRDLYVLVAFYWTRTDKQYSCMYCRRPILVDSSVYYGAYSCRNSHTIQMRFCSQDCKDYYFNTMSGCPGIIEDCSHCVDGWSKCNSCNGNGIVPITSPCLSHLISGNHYYCTSSSHHGNNVLQYHK